MEDLDEIYKIQENLYIGAYWPRLNFEKIEQEGITAIVNLMENEYYKPPSKYFYLHKGFPDDSEVPEKYRNEILEFIDIHSQQGKVLVHCAMGISRSGGIVVAWLLKNNPNWDWNFAMDYVRQFRKIYPAVEIKKSVLNYLELIEGRKR